MSLLACGLSAAMNSTLLSIRGTRASVKENRPALTWPGLQMGEFERHSPAVEPRSAG